MIELRECRIHIQTVDLKVWSLAVKQDAPQLAQAIDGLGAAQCINNIRRGFAIEMLKETKRIQLVI